jgi:hypothetical protein
MLDPTPDVNTNAMVDGELRMEYEQHKQLLTAIVLTGLLPERAADDYDSEVVERAKRIVSYINGEAEFEGA